MNPLPSTPRSVPSKPLSATLSNFRYGFPTLTAQSRWAPEGLTDSIQFLNRYSLTGGLTPSTEGITAAPTFTATINKPFAGTNTSNIKMGTLVRRSANIPLPSYEGSLSRKTARALPASIAALLVIWCVPSAQAIEEVWIGGADGTWSQGANWIDGTAPVSDADLNLQFQPGSGKAVIATSDLGANFELNRLTFQNNAANPLTLSGNSLRLSGLGAGIDLQGAGDVTIANTLILNSSDNITTIGGSGAGDLNITTGITSTAFQRLVIAGQTTSFNSQVITLSGTVAPSGGITLQSGNLAIGNANVLGTGPFVVNGGTLRFSVGSLNLAKAVSLNSDLVVAMANNATLSGVLSSATNGTGLTLRTNTGNSTLTLTAASTYNGATRIDVGPVSTAAFGPAGTILLSGSGSILNSSLIDIRANGTIQFNGVSGGSTNRIGDSTPVELRSGRLSFNAVSGSTPQSETIGALSVGGDSTVTIAPTTTVGARLTANSLMRIEHGTVLFRGANLGGTLAPGVGNIRFSTAPSLTGGGGAGLETSILPYAVGDNSSTGVGSGFVTYDSISGIRLLDVASEYVSSLPAASATHNVRLAASTPNDGVATINSLVLAGAPVTGAGTLNITSGALLSTSSGSSIRNAVSFGATDGKITTAGDLTISGQIQGAGGLTKSGARTLTLTAATNPFTGGLTINAGSIAFSSEGQLGAESSTIVFNGQDAGLRYSASGTLTLARNISVSSGVGLLSSIAGGTFELSGTISGPGGLHLGTAQDSTLVLSGNNTFSGPVYLTGGTVVINSDAALGTGELNLGGVVRLGGNWTTSRTIRGGGTIDTAGFDATWNGLLISSPFVSTPITKTGAGTLTISGAIPGTIGFSVNGGTLRFNAAQAPGSTTFSVSTGGKLLLDKTGLVSVDQIGDGATINLNGGEFIQAGNAAAPVAETVGTVTINTGSILSLSNPGNFTNTVKASTLTTNNGYLIVRGDRLGGASNVPFSRFAIANAPASSGGLINDVYAEDPASGTPVSFAVYDVTSDAAGVVGARPVNATEVTLGSAIQNPANGGTTPTNANFVGGAGLTTLGATNSVNSLTLNNGGNLTLTPTQTLTLGSGKILVRPGAASSSIDGGTIDFGTIPGSIANFADLVLSSKIEGTGGWVKTGTGMLNLLTAPLNTGEIKVSGGRLRIGSETTLAGRALTVGPGAVFDLNNTPATLGQLSGAGSVELGGNTLTLGTLGTDYTLPAALIGPGTVKLVDPANSKALRTISGAAQNNTIVSLESGRFQFGEFTSTGGRVELNGGTIDQISFVGTLSSALVLNQSLLMNGSGYLTITGSGGITGSGDVIVQGSGSLTISTQAQHTGITGTSFARGTSPSSQSGRISIAGAEGALTSTSAIVLNPDSRLTLESGFTGPAGGRIADGTPVQLKNAGLYLWPDTSETIGVLSGSGSSAIQLEAGTSASTTLTAAELRRVQRGTFQFIGSNLGAAPGPNVATIRFTIPAAGLIGGGGTGPNTSILPYAVGSEPSWNPTFVTYDAVQGVRLLNSATEYGTVINTATATANVSLMHEEVLSGPKTINALRLTSSSPVSGTGPLTITSGAILAGNIEEPGGQIQTPLAFGNAEAFIFSSNTTLTISSPISGTNGLTKFGGGDLLLSGANTFTGPLTINGGEVLFNDSSNLGADASPITINASVSVWGGLGALAGNVTLSRNIETNTGFASLRSSAQPGSNFVVSGTISGSGGIAIHGTGYVSLTGTNTYTGPTIVDGGLAIASDASLGNGGVIELKDDTAGLKLLGAWTTNRSIIVSSQNSRILTNGFDATWNGSLAGNENVSLTKSGDGTLTIQSAKDFQGVVTVDGGTLLLQGEDSASQYNVVAGGRLAGRGSTPAEVLVSGTISPGDNGIGTLRTGSLSLNNGANLNIELESAAAYDRVEASGSVSLTDGANLTLSILPGFQPAYGSLFTIIDNDALDAVTGGRLFFAGNALDEGERFFAGPFEFQISYAGGTGNDVTLLSIPEPSAAAILTIAAVGLASRRRSPSRFSVRIPARGQGRQHSR